MCIVKILSIFLSFQLENFTESEYRILCDHLGHTLPVHKRYYRLRDTTTELTKVAKMLLTADDGAFAEENDVDVGPTEDGIIETPQSDLPATTISKKKNPGESDK